MRNESAVARGMFCALCAVDNHPDCNGLFLLVIYIFFSKLVDILFWIIVVSFYI